MKFIEAADGSAINAAHVSRIFVRGRQPVELCASTWGPQMPHVLGEYETEVQARLIKNYVLHQLMREYGDDRDFVHPSIIDPDVLK